MPGRGVSLHAGLHWWCMYVAQPRWICTDRAFRNVGQEWGWTPGSRFGRAPPPKVTVATRRSYFYFFSNCRQTACPCTSGHFRTEGFRTRYLQSSTTYSSLIPGVPRGKVVAADGRLRGKLLALTKTRYNSIMTKASLHTHVFLVEKQGITSDDAVIAASRRLLLLPMRGGVVGCSICFAVIDSAECTESLQWKMVFPELMAGNIFHAVLIISRRRRTQRTGVGYSATGSLTSYRSRKGARGLSLPVCATPEERV